MTKRWLVNFLLCWRPRVPGYMGSSKSESAGVWYGANQRQKNFHCKIYSHKIFSYVFCVRKYENIFTTKIK